MDSTNSSLEVTYPYEETSPGVSRVQCTECGGWERSDKGNGQIRHSKRCDSKAQPATVAAATAVRATESRSYDLRQFARQVTRTGLTNGRDQDVRDAVRAGYLSESAAMNTDD